MGLNIASEATQERIANALEMMVAHQIEQDGGDFNPTEAQSVVRHGMGAATYPVGTQFPLTHSVYGSHKHDVIGHDHDQDAHGHFDHSMTIQMDDQIADGTPFDMPEALVYAVQAISAGTSFHFSHTAALNDVPAGNYQFTLTEAVPAGGQIMLVKSGTAWQVKTYSGPTSTTVIETVNCVTGSTGTDLGNILDTSNTLMHAGIKASGITEGTALVINHGSCTQYGYNRWSQSAIRQWLNSSAAANSWWTPQNVFDRPPSYASRPGYLAGFDAAFVSALGEITHSTVLNTVTDGGTSETVTDKVFLLSRKEVGLGNEIANQNDGSVYEYYDGATNKDRVKLRGASAAYWWLRTPLSGFAVIVRSVGTDGSLISVSGAGGAYGVAPACVIM